MSQNRSKISGEKCPVSYDSREQTVTTFSTIDEKTPIFSGQSDFESQASFKVNDDHVKTLATTAGYVTTINMKGIFENYSPSENYMKPKSGAAYAKGGANGEFVMADDSKVSETLVMEMITRPDNSAIQFILRLKFPDGDAVVGFHQKGDQARYFLNGEPVSEDDVKNVYGFDNFGLPIKNQ